MFRISVKSAWRDLLKDKQFSLLNFLGLSTGLACLFLIVLWVKDERSVDKFNANDERLFQVLKRNPEGAGSVSVSEKTQGLLAESLAREFPEVEVSTCARKQSAAGILSVGEKAIKVSTAFAGRDFFSVFSYPVLYRDKSKLLSDVSRVMLSDETALKLFGRMDVVGRTVSLNQKDNGPDFSNVYTIGAVFKAPPANATEQFDILLPFELYASKNAGGQGDVTFWGSNMVSTYIVLKPKTDMAAFGAKIKNYTKDKVAAMYSGKGFEDYEGELFLQKYSDRYLHNRFNNGRESGGRITYVKLFSAIAIFILLIACINFMNLSTAKSSRRMKEIGVKKVIGAGRGQLILQYLSESVIMALISLIGAGLIAALFLPAFRNITGKPIAFTLSPGLLPTAVLLAVLTGLVAGSYPAFYLSRFKPISILKGKLRASAGELWVRKGLVVFQFLISSILIIAVMVVYRQMKLIHTTNLGYEKDHVIRFANDGIPGVNLPAFISAVKQVPGVVDAGTVSGDFVGNYYHSGGGIDWPGKDPNLRLEYYGIQADADYFQTMGLQLSEGRVFSKAFADSSGVIFNQAAIRAMGIKNPIGKIVSLWGDKKQIVGVVKDFHFQSLYNRIGPAFFTYSDKNPSTVVKIRPGMEPEAIDGIASIYKGYDNGLDLAYTFLDDEYAKLYVAEQRIGILSRYFAGIAILISCLGLFGLSAFTAQQRQKEIGIRKVLGASVSGVVGMLSKDFLSLVCLALAMAIPLAWWGANKWLEGFAYRVDLTPEVFAATSLVVTLITFLAIGYQSIKAALINPANTLRSE